MTSRHVMHHWWLLAPNMNVYGVRAFMLRITCYVSVRTTSWVSTIYYKCLFLVSTFKNLIYLPKSISYISCVGVYVGWRYTSCICVYVGWCYTSCIGCVCGVRLHIMCWCVCGVRLHIMYWCVCGVRLHIMYWLCMRGDATHHVYVGRC